MQKENCSHLWEMVNLSNGLIVMKKCFHCAKVSICFTFHNKPPVEPSHEGEHFWNFMESDPSFHFDLKCNKCGTLVEFRELAGLMMCTGCDETCQVGILKRKLEPDNKRVCIALGYYPVDVDALGLGYHLLGFVDNGEVSQPQEVHLQQPDPGDILHSELGRSEARPTVPARSPVANAGSEALWI